MGVVVRVFVCVRVGERVRIILCRCALECLICVRVGGGAMASDALVKTKNNVRVSGGGDLIVNVVR